MQTMHTKGAFGAMLVALSRDAATGKINRFHYALDDVKLGGTQWVLDTVQLLATAQKHGAEPKEPSFIREGNAAKVISDVQEALGYLYFFPTKTQETADKKPVHAEIRGRRMLIPKPC